MKYYVCDRASRVWREPIGEVGEILVGQGQLVEVRNDVEARHGLALGKVRDGENEGHCDCVKVEEVCEIHDGLLWPRVSSVDKCCS